MNIIIYLMYNITYNIFSQEISNSLGNYELVITKKYEYSTTYPFDLIIFSLKLRLWLILYTIMDILIYYFLR
jgi:hypothetical protein